MRAARGSAVLGRERWRRWLRRALCWVAVAMLAACAFVAALWKLCPFPLAAIDAFPAGARVLDRGGRILRVFGSARGEMLFPVEAREMSPWLRSATVAVEDKRFFAHPGVDPFAVIRAAAQNVMRGEIHSGASTLTMQLVRITQNRPRTLRAKIVESFYALQIDAWRDKDAILTAYLNLAPYGGNLRGVEAASLRYFGKSAAHLTLSEAALVAGLPQAPERLRPDRAYERALARRRVVLRAMLETGAITLREFADALRDRPAVASHPWPFAAPHPSEVARERSSDSSIRTSLDPSVQALAEQRLTEWFDAAPATRRRLSGAVVVVDVETAELRAWVGSADYFDVERSGMVDAVTAPRAAGSTLKPFLYALAFDRGIAAPTTWLPDVPAAFARYVPENFDRIFNGPVPAAEALTRSLNLPSLALLGRVGVPELIGVLRRLGLTTLAEDADRYGLTLALGSGEVRLIDLAGAYATLARGGVHLRPRLVAGESGASEIVLSDAACYVIHDALSARDHLRSAGHAPASARRLAYKTGTSRALRDAWCVAFDERWVVGVWLGDPRGAAHPDLIGVEAAAPIALDIARALPAPVVGRAPPPSLVSLAVCAVSGYPPGESCDALSIGRFSLRWPALPRCAIHRRGAGGEVVEVWPAEVRAFRARQRSSREARRGAESSATAAIGGGASGERPRILAPVAGSEYLRLDAAPFAQELYFSAALADDARAAFWFVDGVFVAEAALGESVPWPIERGDHIVACVDDQGRASRSRIRVR